MNKRILCLSLAVLMLLTSVFSLASCMGPDNTDPPTTQTCTNHTDANHDGKCDVATCGAAVTAAHVDANHDGKCDTPACVNKTMEIKHDAPDADYNCVTCGKPIEHEHVNENGACKLCGKDMSVGAHDCIDEEGDDELCDICFEEMPVPECEQCTDLNSDRVCDVCGKDVDCNCVDTNNDTYCDYCQAYVAPAEVEIDYPWDTDTIIMQLTENTNGQEILSVSKKYLAGDVNAGSDNITESVRKRNALATAKTGISVTYRYYPDTAEYNWGTSIERIQQTNLTGGNDAPDVYCNFVYDMVGASLKECFANLLANGISETRGTNYFEFLNEDYNPARSDRGFMYEYMESLTLAPGKKMYVLASDYFIDMVRAFFCVPVSVKIMEDSGAAIVAQNEAGLTLYEGGDRNGDGKFDLDDFYKLVKDGEWTYNTLAKFAEAVYKPAASNDGTCVIGDDIVGFAMASGGLSASGLLYTTSVEIIKKESNGQGGYEYNYPSDNQDFYAFCDATKKLFGESKGVCFVSANYSQYGDSSLLAIRKRFTENKVLFGDVMLVGALEFDAYQEMKTTGGFGVVPVPLYRSGSTDKYLTQIHNMGSCGGISIITKKFSQCTAFLNYQSTHSEDILNDYYKYKLQYDLSNGSSGTIEMLQYIRDNVRSSFDKAMEDAIGVFNTEASKTKWHNVLSTNKFQIDIRAEYSKNYNVKEQYLDDLAKAFQNFPD